MTMHATTHRYVFVAVCCDKTRIIVLEGHFLNQVENSLCQFAYFIPGLTITVNARRSMRNDEYKTI